MDLSAASTSQAIDKLVSLLTNEVRLVKVAGESKVLSLRNDLEHLRFFLEEADAKSENDESVKAWLNEIKEVTELIEDVVDEYILKESKRPREGGFISFFGKAGRLIGTLNSRRNLASNIQNIKVLLREIKDRGQTYHLAPRRSRINVERDQTRSVSPLLEDVVVGFDSLGSELIKGLTEGASGRSVISIVGAGGMGKTTLVKIVYNNEMAREHFDCHAWITVTKTNSLDELLKSMAKQICIAEEDNGGDINFDTMSIEELISTLRVSLRSKRYMVVFDDVWKMDFWEIVKHALPHTDKGSRVIITTRNGTIAASFKESPYDLVHELKPLSEAMSWDLFCRIAFQLHPEFRCPPELEQLSLEFIRICEGLPLAIVTIAGLLSTKVNLSEWTRLLESTRSNSNPALAKVSNILALSFQDLPSRLKLCLLYFSIFPQGFLIPNDKLFKLWIAEGFVQEKRGFTLEEIAEEYLNELINRYMVQTWHWQGFYELDSFCRVHDMMHDFTRQKADEFNFCRIHDDTNSDYGRKVRRLSIQNNAENVLKTIDESQVRSVLLFNIGALPNSFLVNLFERYKLLTLLDFENVPLDVLPSELGNLFHLKYLNLKNTKVKTLPKSVGKLYNLRTLDLRNTLLIELPAEINKLQNLRHLLAGDYEIKISSVSTRGVRLEKGIGCLENLQTLMTVDAHPSGFGERELENLRQLRRLGLSRLTAEFSRVLCAYFEKMTHLEYLSLESWNDSEILNLQNISSPMHFLKTLVLRGVLPILPHWIPTLQSLSMLCLSFSKLTNDPLDNLCHLPNLVSLSLYQAYDGEHLHFEKGGFPKLKLLVLRELHGLKLVEIEEEALPCLEELTIASNPLLNVVPSGVQHLKNLQVLANFDMPTEFVLSMNPDGGSEYWKVEHIPSVHFWYRVEGGRNYTLYKLGEPQLLDHLQCLASNINDVTQREVGLSLFNHNGEKVSAPTWNDVNRSSFSSDCNSFFSDDIED